MSTQNKSTNKTEQTAIIAFIVAVFAVFAAILIIPSTREGFKTLSSTHPYLMGFVKFGFLATAGELIAGRLASGAFKKPPYITARFIIWGLIGIWITYMMKIFNLGAAAMMAKQLLPSSGNEFTNKLLLAFFTSATMNLSFGPTFMALHKCSDTYLALRAKRTAKNEKIGVKKVVGSVDWSSFVTFTLFKTVPIFWIPAHTVTFLLPGEYQVMLAALLSVALGIILNLKKKPAAE